MAQDFILGLKIQEGFENLIQKALDKRGRDNYYLYGFVILDNDDGTYKVKVNKDIWILKPRVV